MRSDEILVIGAGPAVAMAGLVVAMLGVLYLVNTVYSPIPSAEHIRVVNREIVFVRGMSDLRA